LRTNHTMEEAIEIQKNFEQLYCHRPGMLGVGIRKAPTGEFALSVQLRSGRDGKGLPSEFFGLDVVTDVVGSLKAL
jgi:hypothetical protein